MSSSWSPLRLVAGRMMHEDDYLVECNTILWQTGVIRQEVAFFIFYPDGGRKCLSNTDTFLPDYVVSHTRRM
jgi:hypothetical protein